MKPVEIALYEAGKAIGCVGACLLLKDKPGALQWLQKAREYIAEAERLISGPTKQGGRR